MRKFLSVLFLIPTLALFSQSYLPQTVPNPKSDVSDSWITDPANYLTESQYEQINNACVDLKNRVNVELAVVMLPQYDRDKYDRFTFCQELFNLWGIGDAQKNTGVLVFFADGPVGYRDIRIHTGGGMEGLLTDYACSSFIDDAYNDLADGNFGKGVMIIVSDIYNRLTTEDAENELLLGWTPKHADSENGILLWLFVGFAVLWYFCYVIYKKAPITKDMSPEQVDNVVEELESKQTPMGWLGWLLLPMWLLYGYIHIQKRRLRKMPAKCPNCKHTMNVVSEDKIMNFLDDKQRVEQSLKSKKYFVYECSSCGCKETFSHEGANYSKYTSCPTCGALAGLVTSTSIAVKSTYSNSGKKTVNYACQCCGNMYYRDVIIPKLVRTASSGSSGYSRGSSFGTSGGSWGGGHSFGGGAGRSF